MVAAVGLVVKRELRVGPIELARIDDHAADAGAVSADPLRERVDDEVRAVVQRAQQRRRREGRVDDEREVVLLRDGRVALDVRDVEGRVADGLDEDQARLLVDRGLHGGEVVHRGEVHLDAGVRQDRVELREGASIEVVRRDDLVAGLRDVRDGEEDRRRAGGERLGRRAALECREALGEDVVRRVHEAGVDVAQLAKAEEVGAVLRVAEVVGGGAVHGDGARVGRRVAVWVLAGVYRQRFNVEVAHGGTSGLVVSGQWSVVSG